MTGGSAKRDMYIAAPGQETVFDCRVCAVSEIEGSAEVFVGIEIRESWTKRQLDVKFKKDKSTDDRAAAEIGDPEPDSEDTSSEDDAAQFRSPYGNRMRRGAAATRGLAMMLNDEQSNAQRSDTPSGNRPPMSQVSLRSSLQSASSAHSQTSESKKKAPSHDFYISRKSLSISDVWPQQDEASAVLQGRFITKLLANRKFTQSTNYELK